jgi:hypothetical protein
MDRRETRRNLILDILDDVYTTQSSYRQEIYLIILKSRNLSNKPLIFFKSKNRSGQGVGVVAILEK